jgi:putative sigma-54 modulation protein
MQVNIDGHHVELTPPLKEYVHKRLKRLDKHFSNITNVHVTLIVEKKYQQIAEAKVNLSGGGKDIFAKAENEDMYASIDQLVDRLDRQVIKHKEMLQSKSSKNEGELSD